MKVPQFLFEEFVDDTIFNSAMAVLQASITETGSGGVFLIAGVINPASLIFSFTTNSLVVGVTTPDSGSNPFKCLFNSGVIAAGHGIVDGQDTQVYSVNFGPLVPLTGSVTAYIVAQQLTVQESPTTIIGAPPGHPDYSPNFVPYIGYNVIQDTLNIFATTTAPDNLVTIELARTTLVAGQTSITSVNTSFQVLAKVNSQAVVLEGDVTGPSGSNMISFLQGNPVSVTTPAANSFLTFNGTTWVAGAGILAGDITGPIGSNRISNLQGKPVSANAPSTGQVLQYNGTQWIASSSLSPTGPAGGDLNGNYPDPIVVGVEGVPIFGAPTTSGQSLVYSSTPSPRFNWLAQSLGAVYGPYTLGGSVALNNAGPPVPVLSTTTINLPATNSWRIIVTYTLCIVGVNSGTPQRETAMVTDNHGHQFGEAMQNPQDITNGFINGFDISPLYAGGTSVILTLQAASDSNGSSTPHAVQTVTSTDVVVTTSFTAFLIPAVA
jgi:hypothetical protein